MKISRTNETTRTRLVPLFESVIKISNFSPKYSMRNDNGRLYRVENPKRLPNTRSN